MRKVSFARRLPGRAQQQQQEGNVRNRPVQLQFYNPEKFCMRLFCKVFRYWQRRIKILFDTVNKIRISAKLCQFEMSTLDIEPKPDPDPSTMVISYKPRVLIIGAGPTASLISYLIKGNEKLKQLFDLQIWEKSRGIGGRFSNKRCPSLNEKCYLDLGAQYLTQTKNHASKKYYDGKYKLCIQSTPSIF